MAEIKNVDIFMPVNFLTSTVKDGGRAISLLPAYLITISGYMVTVGAVGAAVSKLTVSDKVDANE
jgi:hypothetical protein